MKLLDHVMLLLRTDAKMGAKAFVSDDTKALAEAAEARHRRQEESLAAVTREVRAIRSRMHMDEA